METRKFIICILYLLLTGSTPAQEQGLTDDQRQNYYTGKLSIIRGEKPGNIRKWQAYRGYAPISEIALFQLAGTHEDINQINNYRENARKKMKIGMVGMIARAAVALVGGLKLYDPEAKSHNTVSLAGLAIFGISFGVFNNGQVKTQKNWAPYQKARKISDKFNKQLLIQIEGSF
ncbi:MAG: hypothetical protein GY839_05005 [candidate division Zixibacteria bacterium]|nr:hypothetical protein [candidate division Zixibacteria bacterium]